MKRLIAALILALAFAGMSARAETVGRVLLAAGDVVAVRAGKALPLAAGTLIEDKDTLRTGAASNLQVRFTDSSIMSLRENSELAIEEYRFGGSAGGLEKAFYKLLKGGLRTVTGLIGRTRHDNYRIDSVTATIGIRGTHFALMSCQAGSCLNADGSKAKDGLYGGVTDGIVAAITKTGEYRFGAGDAFFAASIDSPVDKLIGPPVFLSDRLEGQKRGSKKADSESGTNAATGNASGSEETKSGGIQADSRPNTIPAPLPQLQVVTTETLNVQGATATLPLAAANGWVSIYPVSALANSAEVVFDDNKKVGFFNSSNHLLSYGSAGTYPYGTLNGGTIVDSGSHTYPTGQVLTWGRWTGPTQIVASSGATLNGVPVLFGTASGLTQNTSLPAGGTATYTYVGGPKPVDAGGNVGSITSNTLVLNFTTQQAAFAMGVNFAGIGAAFTVGGTGTKTSGSYTGDFSGALSGTCIGGGCASTLVNGKFAGGTDGANAELAVIGGGFSGTTAGPVIFLNAYQSSSFTPGPLSKTLAVAYGTSTWSNHVVQSQFNGDIMTFSGNNLTSFNSPAGPTAFAAGNLNSGTVVETGSVTAVDGSVMQWGRWMGSTVTVVGSTASVTNPPTGVPYVYGDYTSVLPTSGTFTYSYAGGPNPVDGLGNVGTFNGGAFSVSFGSTNAISIATPLSLTVASTNYSLTTLCGGSCTFGSSSSNNINANLTGTCSGGICSTGNSVSGSMSGRFTGVSAGGLAVAGNVGGTNVTFAGAFKR